MLKLLNQNKKLMANINNYSDLCIESELTTFDSTLSFKYPLNALFKNDIKEEGYIRTKLNEYVIKEVNTRNNILEVYCSLNFEDLEGKFFEHFNTVTTTIEECLNLAFAGTGWIIGSSNILRKRTIKLTNVTSFKILKEAKKVFRAEFKVDAINKKIFIFEKIGEDKGVYFAESLNLKNIETQSNTYDFITRLIVEGKDGLTIESINNNKKYIENFQYSNKIKTYFWKDERYTSKESLKEDGEYKLNELSKPAKSYNLEIVNLAKINKYYKDILDYKLGDTITLLSKTHKLKEKQRIVKITEYPEDPTKNTCELSNTILSFENLQQDLQDTADTIDNVTTDNGTIDGSTVDEIDKEQIKNFDIEVGKVVNLDVVNAKIENLIVNKADITSLNAVNANIGNLQATKANITDLQATNATISNLQATKADIADLQATNAKISILEVETAKIGVLEGDVANIQDIVNGNLSSENIQTGGITGDRLNMNTIFVTDANIVNVNANKINTGEIDTSKVKIKSADGGIEIVGPTQQWKDKNNKVRMQAGKDAQGNFTFGIFDETGTGTLIDHTGIKEKALGTNIIKENMIAPDAVGEKQINYNSFASGFNKDTNTSQIKGSKVRLDNQNQSLEVAFTSLKSKADGTQTQTESNTTQINVSNGKIETAIANTKIVKDGKEVLLKDDYNTTVTTVNSMKNTISSHTTKIDGNTGKITGVESKTNILERDLNSMSSKLSSTEATVNTHTTQINTVTGTANSAIDKANKAQSDATKNKNDIVTVNTEVTNTKNKVSGIEQDLDSITQRVGSVETTTVSHTASINAVDGKINTAKNQAISNAATDAQNKANKALNDSKGYTNTEVTKVITSTNSKFAEIKTTTDSITQTVSNTNKEVETVKVNLTNKTSINEQTKVNGQELLPQGYKVNIADGFDCVNNSKVLFNDNKITVKGNLWIKTVPTLIKFDRTKPLYWKVNATTTGAQFYVGVERYDKNKNVINNAANGACVYFVSGSTTLNGVVEGWWNETDKATAYIQLRILCDWNNTGKDTIINEISWKQLSASSQLDTSKEILDITTEKVNQAKADIKITTDAISSKVSQVETTTNTINVKVNSHESRLTSAEQKITSNAIINTVSSTVNQAKTEAINSANSSTDVKLNNFTSKQEFTEFKQTSQNIQAKIVSTSGINFISNPVFNTGNIQNWSLWGNPSWSIKEDVSLGFNYSLKLQCNKSNG
ncbi:MAG: phage tail spike protein, partial [Sarcina sp.]